MFSIANPHSLVPTKAPMMVVGIEGICYAVDYGPTSFGNSCQGFILRISYNANIIPSEAKGSYPYRFPSDAIDFFTGHSKFLVTDYEVFTLLN